MEHISKKVAGLLVLCYKTLPNRDLVLKQLEGSKFGEEEQIVNRQKLLAGHLSRRFPY